MKKLLTLLITVGLTLLSANAIAMTPIVAKVSTTVVQPPRPAATSKLVLEQTNTLDLSKSTTRVSLTRKAPSLEYRLALGLVDITAPRLSASAKLEVKRQFELKNHKIAFKAGGALDIDGTKIVPALSTTLALNERVSLEGTAKFEQFTNVETSLSVNILLWSW